MQVSNLKCKFISFLSIRFYGNLVLKPLIFIFSKLPIPYKPLYDINLPPAFNDIRQQKINASRVRRKNINKSIRDFQLFDINVFNSFKINKFIISIKFIVRHVWKLIIQGLFISSLGSINVFSPKTISTTDLRFGILNFFLYHPNSLNNDILNRRLQIHF